MDTEAAIFAPPRGQLPPVEVVRELLDAMSALKRPEDARKLQVLAPLVEGGGSTASVPPGSLTAELLQQFFDSPAVPEWGSEGFVGMSGPVTNDALIIVYGVTRCSRLLARMRVRAKTDLSLAWAMRSLGEQFPDVWGE